MHDEIGGPGAGLGVSGIVDGAEGDGGTIVLPLVSCSSVICFWRLSIDQSEGRPEVGGEDVLKIIVALPSAEIVWKRLVHVALRRTRAINH